MHLSIPSVSFQNSFISPVPTSQPQKHRPGVIQSSPHAHPSHKKNKMGDVTEPSPDPYISTPPSPPGSWRGLSCSWFLANLACVPFRSCVPFRFGTSLTKSKPTTHAQSSFGQGRVFLVSYSTFFPSFPVVHLVNETLPHEGYHRGQKSCPVPHVPSWLATRGNLHLDIRFYYPLSILLFLWGSSIAVGV